MVCRKGRQNLNTFDKIVNDYIQKHRKSVEKELRFYHKLTFDQAIESAAHTKNSDCTRDIHHSRAPQHVLDETASKLMRVRNQIESCQSFDELIQIVKETIEIIKGIGPLTIYDIALRIGANLSRYPQKIYLHTGTKKGATILRVGRGRKCIAPPELYEISRAFTKLKPYEIEDCLCIYRDCFRGIKEK